MKSLKIGLLSLSVVVTVVLASCSGGNADKQERADEKAAAAPAAAATPVSGEEVYKKTCSACHQPDGKGIQKTFPPLAKSDFIANKEASIKQVIEGKTGELVVNGEKYNNTMPPQALSDDEIAAVLTYVYSNFGNTGGPVTADEVKSVRAKR
jgi:nitrite reductase (NO-forming)